MFNQMMAFGPRGKPTTAAQALVQWWGKASTGSRGAAEEMVYVALTRANGCAAAAAVSLILNAPSHIRDLIEELEPLPCNTAALLSHEDEDQEQHLFLQDNFVAGNERGYDQKNANRRQEINMKEENNSVVEEKTIDFPTIIATTDHAKTIGNAAEASQSHILVEEIRIFETSQDHGIVAQSVDVGSSEGQSHGERKRRRVVSRKIMAAQCALSRSRQRLTPSKNFKRNVDGSAAAVSEEVLNSGRRRRISGHFGRNRAIHSFIYHASWPTILRGNTGTGSLARALIRRRLSSTKKSQSALSASLKRRQSVSFAEVGSKLSQLPSTSSSISSAPNSPCAPSLSTSPSQHIAEKLAPNSGTANSETSVKEEISLPVDGVTGNDRLCSEKQRKSHRCASTPIPNERPSQQRSNDKGIHVKNSPEGHKNQLENKIETWKWKLTKAVAEDCANEGRRSAAASANTENSLTGKKQKRSTPFRKIVNDQVQDDGDSTFHDGKILCGIKEDSCRVAEVQSRNDHGEVNVSEQVTQVLDSCSRSEKRTRYANNTNSQKVLGNAYHPAHTRRLASEHLTPCNTKLVGVPSASTLVETQKLDSASKECCLKDASQDLRRLDIELERGNQISSNVDCRDHRRRPASPSQDPHPCLPGNKSFNDAKTLRRRIKYKWTKTVCYCGTVMSERPQQQYKGRQVF